jgi:hypothetical protein
MFAEGEIWRKSMEGTFKDDISFLARMEHPDWDEDKIADHADDVKDKNPFHDVQTADLADVLGPAPAKAVVAVAKKK